MLFLNFGSNKNKYCNLFDMNFFMITNVINVNKYQDPDPLFPNVDPDPLLRKDGSEDPDPLFPNGYMTYIILLSVSQYMLFNKEH